jgi:hypothetical protein
LVRLPASVTPAARSWSAWSGWTESETKKTQTSPARGNDCVQLLLLVRSQLLFDLVQQRRFRGFPRIFRRVQRESSISDVRRVRRCTIQDGFERLSLLFDIVLQRFKLSLAILDERFNGRNLRVRQPQRVLNSRPGIPLSSTSAVGCRLRKESASQHKHSGYRQYYPSHIGLNLVQISLSLP